MMPSVRPFVCPSVPTTVTSELFFRYIATSELGPTSELGSDVGELKRSEMLCLLQKNEKIMGVQMSQELYGRTSLSEIRFAMVEKLTQESYNLGT